MDTMGSANYTGYNFLEDSVKAEINRFDPRESIAKNSSIESQDKICTFITSSFIYDRYLRAAKFSGQGEWVYKKNYFYQSLFDRPFQDINPREPSYSFVNPTLRVVNLCLPKTE
jgi:hypothetical protein